MLQSTLYRPFEIILVSQKEDDYLIERVFELAYSNKHVLVCIFIANFFYSILIEKMILFIYFFY